MLGHWGFHTLLIMKGKNVLKKQKATTIAVPIKTQTQQKTVLVKWSDFSEITQRKTPYRNHRPYDIY
ncbi:hypothetical protein IMPR6_50006 [Imperialibacter sp. EC-SDR9]|nr:hypothetical protein IMPERIA89_50283 [Imperialibacter sp. 89]CAD5285662.1 hypothetical protein IMPERIA75_600006 [Imperialibacter sp. 75]VVT29474.1 hypothetical protein IMPR6_50006 [Imperialibacter sp. EC-SDR9]